MQKEKKSSVKAKSDLNIKAKGKNALNNAVDKLTFKSLDKMPVFFIIGIIAIFASFFLDDIFAEFMKFIQNPLFDAVAGIFNTLTAVIIIVLLFVIILLLKKETRKWIPAMLLGFLFSIIVSTAIKFFFMRPRPENYIKLIPFTSIPDYSFPSFHSTSFFSLVPVLNRAYPNIKWLFYALALIVSFSRVYLGLHHLSDIVAGAVIGIVVGELALLVTIKKGSNYFSCKGKNG